MSLDSQYGVCFRACMAHLIAIVLRDGKKHLLDVLIEGGHKNVGDTVATGLLLFPRIWGRHYGKIAAGWSALTLLAIAFAFGAGTVLDAFVHTMLLDYVSFIAVLLSLYVVAGGIWRRVCY